jgi:hypothetical protein
VRIFKHELTNKNNFITIYTAKGIGIIKMEKLNGDVWINNNLKENKNYDFDSFDYTQRYDE